MSLLYWSFGPSSFEKSASITYQSKEDKALLWAHHVVYY